MDITKEFEKETGEEKPMSNGFLKITYLQKYIKWLEFKLKNNKDLLTVINRFNG